LCKALYTGTQLPRWPGPGVPWPGTPVSQLAYKGW